MAVGKGKEDDLEGDVAYELLEVGFDASEKEITTAYRKASLKCHPDRNKDDPDAAEKFDRLTRAKDLLLDPARRALVDEQRKAKEELEKRYAQQDGKRRKLREDLEARETAASGGKSPAAAAAAKESAEEARKRYVQADFAARLKAKNAEIASRQSDLAAELSKARGDVEEARLQATWREGASVSLEVIKATLSEFNILSVEMDEGCAVIQVASREEAIRAVLECRARRQQMPFRVGMAKLPASQQAAAPEQPEKKVKKKQEKPAGAGGGAAFGKFEADILGDLAGLVAAQKKKKKKPAAPDDTAAGEQAPEAAAPA
eukprot:TRINITY_DN22636_c0_g1_i1.p1 TRINITY_DN22636_c0_g1~~TRINITY_DN22636_c0_g1_i1.p1  ORF type:complete len:317 (+),score=109.75 TRINITY_DN22636_c0_g1_i1:72-1022(+)